MAFDARERTDGAWEVIDIHSGKPVRIAGIPLANLTGDEARGAIHLLRENAIEPDPFG